MECMWDAGPGIAAAMALLYDIEIDRLDRVFPGLGNLSSSLLIGSHILGGGTHSFEVTNVAFWGKPNFYANNLTRQLRQLRYML